MNPLALQKNSFIDYPGRISCVLFTAGCNFHCPYCHNPHLAKGALPPDAAVPEETAMAFLASRRGLLEGVVISGGEPTLDKEIATLCRKAKDMGYPVKLDTNGSRPRELQRLIREALVDYVAMDIKTDPFRYAPYIQEEVDPAKILSSMAIIMESGLPYEFRTTCVRPIVDEKGIEHVARLIAGARMYVLQRMRRQEGVLDPGFFREFGRPYEEEAIQGLKAIAAPWVAECLVR